jgi:hypothetical protein
MPGDRSTFAAGHLPDRVDEPRSPYLFGQDTSGARHRGGHDHAVVVVGGQQQPSGLRVAGPDLPRQLDTIAVGQPEVDHRDVGCCLLEPDQCLGDGSGFTDDPHVAVGLEDFAHAPTDEPRSWITNTAVAVVAERQGPGP